MEKYAVSINRNQRNVFIVEADSRKEAKEKAENEWEYKIRSTDCLHGPVNIQYSDFIEINEEDICEIKD